MSKEAQSNRSDYRVIRKLLVASYGQKILHRQNEYARICVVFSKAGGSWERLFKGSSRDVSLLKSVLKVAYKRGYLTKASVWE